MTKRDFESLFQRGFDKHRIYYDDVENGTSQIRCFKCGAMSGLKKINRRNKVVCSNNHKFTLISYTRKYAEMINDLIVCGPNKECELKSNT